MLEVTILLVLGVLCWVSYTNPTWLTNHWPHMLLPKSAADKFQSWVSKL